MGEEETKHNENKQRQEVTEKEKNRKKEEIEIEENENIEVIKMEEVSATKRKIKDKKAAGIGGIHMEAWRYGGDWIRKEFTKLISQIWKKGLIPRDWKMSIIVPIHKKEDQEIVSNYREISLLALAYKVYAEILRNSLEKGIEKKKILPENRKI